MLDLIIKDYKFTSFVIAINTLIFVLILLNGGPRNADTLLRFGASNPSLILKGDYYRIITSAFIHHSFLHYIFNMIVIYLMVPSVEKKFGTLVVFAVYLLAIIFDGLFTPVLIKNWQAGGGASVGYFGLYGLAIGTLFFYKDPNLRDWAKQFIIPMVLILAVSEIFFRIKNGPPAIFLGYSLGHLTGLVAGLIMAGIFPPLGYDLNKEIRIIFVLLYLGLLILFFYLGYYNMSLKNI